MSQQEWMIVALVNKIDLKMEWKARERFNQN